MSRSELGTPRIPRRWSVEEKRRIVELTQVAGASISAIAHEHDVHPTVVSQWRKLYREGKLAERSPQNGLKASDPAMFLPVKLQSKTALTALAGHTLLEVALPSGTVIRIETPVLDAQLLCTLLAQVQR